MIYREHYIKPVRDFYDADLIKIIIINDDIHYSTSVLKHIKLKDFLLMQNLADNK